MIIIITITANTLLFNIYFVFIIRLQAPAVSLTICVSLRKLLSFSWPYFLHSVSCYCAFQFQKRCHGTCHCSPLLYFKGGCTVVICQLEGVYIYPALPHSHPQHNPLNEVRLLARDGNIPWVKRTQKTAFLLETREKGKIRKIMSQQIILSQKHPTSWRILSSITTKAFVRTVWYSVPLRIRYEK